MKRVFNTILVSLLVFSLSALPAVAGRKRVPHVQDNTYSKPDDLEAEIRFGRDLAARILGNYKLLKNKKIIQYVNKVGKCISLYSGRPELQFYFAVLDTDEINAFATPGGYIFITRGALMKMDNEAQLAAVLGHEIAHVTRRHVVRRLDIRGNDTSAVSALSGMIGGATAAFRNLLETSINQASEILFEKGYKLKEEMEADNLGTLMASSAGYHPSSLKNFLIKSGGFEKKDATYKSKEHPQLDVRMKALNQTLIKNGLLKIKQAKVRRRFHENVKS